jgi:hypothetical protein
MVLTPRFVKVESGAGRPLIRNFVRADVAISIHTDAAVHRRRYLMASRIPYEIVSEILTPLLKHPDPWLLLIDLPARLQSLASRVDATPIQRKEFGLFIRKLRIEGGFGNAMWHA